MSADTGWLPGLLTFVQQLLPQATYQIQLLDSTFAATTYLTSVALGVPASESTAMTAPWPNEAVTQPLVNLAAVTCGPVTSDLSCGGWQLCARAPGSGMTNEPISQTRFDAPVAIASGSSLVLPIGAVIVSVTGFDSKG